MKRKAQLCLVGLSVFVLVACGVSTTPVAPAIVQQEPKVEKKAPPPVAEKVVAPEPKEKENGPPSDDPRKIDGYGKTRWGMTEKEVLEAEAQRVEKLEKPVAFHAWTATLEIRSLEIEHDQYQVLFLFDDTDHKLAQVNLKCLDEGNALLNDRRFLSLEQRLIEKYGPPTFTTNGKGASSESMSAKSSWKLAKTTVELSHSHIPGICSDLRIFYRPVAASKKASNDL